jgi:hypothetical protein
MKKILVLSVLLLTLILLPGCKRSGCTDPDSINYDSKARTNDNSCEYEGEVLFWYNKGAADKNIAAGHTSLTFFLEGKVIGSSAANIYWGNRPECGSAGSVSTTVKLGFSKEKVYKYEIKNQNDAIVWSGNVTLTGNECLRVELL